jgi:hypothetical protein
MKKLFIACSILSILAVSCTKEKTAPPNPADPNSSAMRILSEINVGSGSVTFVANGTNIGILTKSLPGKPSPLGSEMAGLTFAQIHQRLAPSMQVPAELIASKDHFETRSDNSPGGAIEGGFQAATSEELPIAKGSNPGTTDLNDYWFSTNYCNPPSFWNGYNACLLNRTPARGLSTDWAWSNATRTTVYVYPYMGHQIHLRGQVDGSTLFDVDLLSGYVYGYYMFSGTSFWGCRQNKKHYYTITNTEGCGWHWSLRSNLDC